MKSHALLLLAALALVAADKAKKPKPERPKNSGEKETDQELIQGSWRGSQRWLDGRVQNDERWKGDSSDIDRFDISKVTLTFEGDRIMMVSVAEREGDNLKENIKAVMRGSFVLRPKKKPKKLKIIQKQFNRMKTRLIYKLEKDTLTICGAPRGKPIPRDFNPKKGEDRWLMVFKREPKKKSQSKKD